MSVAANGGTNGDVTSGSSPDGGGYSSGSKLEGGQNMTRTITPGGHYANDDLLAIGASHRRLANPLPLGAWSFATTTLVLSLYNVGVQGITVPNAIVTYALFYGGFTQWLAGLWEFASGNTLGASIFVTYGESFVMIAVDDPRLLAQKTDGRVWFASAGMFWWGFSVSII